MIATSFSMAVLEDVDAERSLRTMDYFMLPLLFGTVLMILGSVLPDVDGKGRIRWIMGPVSGAFFIMPFLADMAQGGRITECLDFLTGKGSVLFLTGTLAGYLILLFPFKHRGFMHSFRAAFAFGIIAGIYWGGFTDLWQSILIGSMGTTGYMWHLALDGKLF
jgi:hypothetical protein